MIYLWITLVIFMAFVVLQTLYTFIPLFKNEEKRKITNKYSFSVLVPAFNEEIVIKHCVKGFLKRDYKDAELIIINDGSTDNTLYLLIDMLKLVPFGRKTRVQGLEHQEVIQIYRSQRFANIYVLDKLNGGKADALNAGISFSRNDIVITLDADSILAENSLSEMNKAFQDEKAIACGGNVLMAQGFNREINSVLPTFKIKGILKYQFLQYLTAFYLHKRTQVSLHAITVIAGAFGAFKRDILFQIGGYRRTIGEDMDITLKLHKWIKENGGKEKIIFAPTAICYTECPNTLKNLFRQRVRWQKAFIDCLWYHRKNYFSKFSTRFSLVFLIDQFLIGTLNAFPVIVTPLIIFFYNGHPILLLVFGIGVVSLFSYQSIVTIYVSSLHGINFSKMDIIRILLFLPIEIFIFRMLNLLIVVYGTVTYFYKPQSWNKVDRSGHLNQLKVTEP